MPRPIDPLVRAVRDLGRVAALLGENRVPFTAIAGALVVPSTVAHGAALAFEAE